MESMLLPGQGTRHNRWLFPLAIFAVVLVGFGATAYVGFRVHESRKQNMIDRVSTIARVIDAEDVKLLDGTEADLENPAYIFLKSLLMSIRSVNHDIRFIYINGSADGTLFFYADSEDPDSEDYSPPGESYEEASELMHEMFVTKENGFEIASDRWGTWISALAPIIDESGAVVALIGLDVPADEYILDIFMYCLATLFLTVIVIGFMVAVQYVRTRERQYLDQKAEFLSVASHEIRTPLTGIRWAAEHLLTKESVELPDAARRLLSLVHDNCVTLIGRINNLLSVTALEGGKTVEFKTENILLRPVLEQILDNLKLAAAMKDVALEIDPSLSGVTIRGDGEAIRHIFSNLISNAIKYTRNGTTVTVSYAKGGGMHRISVADRGEGIPASEQNKIFTGFHRTSEAKRSGEHGTGLGLYLVRKLASMHGGTIELVSEEGKGAKFSLVLPEQGV